MKKFIKKFESTLYLGIYYFNKNKLLFSAAGLTFYFILSLVPLFLLIIAILNIIALSHIDFIFELTESLKDINENVIVFFLKIVENSKNTNIFSFGISGIISLIFTSLLFSRSIVNCFKEILNIKLKKYFSILAPLLLNFFILVIVIVAIVLNFSLIFIKNFLINYLHLDATYFIELINRLIFAPMVLIFIIIFFSYYLLSNKTLNIKISAVLSMIFCLVLYIFNWFYSSFASLTYYKLIYGQIGLLIFSLYWVYFLFAIYLYFIQASACYIKYEYFTLDLWLRKKKDLNILEKFILDIGIFDNHVKIDSVDMLKNLKNNKYLIIDGYLKYKSGEKSFLLTTKDILELEKIDIDNIEKVKLSLIPVKN